MRNREDGFTLIEILLAISLLGIVAILLSNTNIAIWNLFNYNIDTIDLKQQGRLLTTILQKDIREANDVKIDVIKDEDDEIIYKDLWLRFGPENSVEREDYRVYRVHAPGSAEYYTIYRMKPPKKSNEKDDETIIVDGWPKEAPGRANSPVLTNVIKNYDFRFKDIDGDGDVDKELVYFEFELVNKRVSYKVENQAYPRLLD